MPFICKSLLTYLKELTGVIITVVYSNGPATNTKIKSNPKISRFKRHIRAVLFEHHLSVQEGALHGATVDLLGLDHQDGSVFQEVIDDELPNPEVFEA